MKWTVIALALATIETTCRRITLAPIWLLALMMGTPFLASPTPLAAETGSIEWTRQWGTDTHDYGQSVSVDNSGNAYVTGNTDGILGGTNAGGADIFLTKIASVPEPSSIALLVCGMGTLLLRRRRRK